MSALPRSARVVRVLVAVTCSFPVVQACGGRSDTEEYLFGADGVTVAGSSGSGAGGTRMGGGGAGALAGRGNSAGAAAAGPLGGNIGVAGRPGVAGGVSVAGTPQGGSGIAGNGSAGAAGSPPGSQITCGDDICDASTESCCAGLAGLNCVSLGQTCNGAVLGCTTNADCGGDICCISTTGDVSDASSCKARCDSTGSGRDRQLCQVDADCRMPFRFCTPTIFGVNICTRRPPEAP